MAAKVHAIEYLAQPKKYPPEPVCVVFGDEAFLQRQALLKLREAVFGSGEDDFSLTVFDGRQAELRDVLQELSTIAMFGGKRLVIVEDADEFVTRYRGELEDYVARANRSAILVLEVNTWPGNTRISKAVAATGLAIDCGAPWKQKQSGFRRDGDGAARLPQWLGDWAKQAHQVELARGAAEMLIRIVGPELGLIDQEIGKLALLAGSDKKVTPEMVNRHVGGWRAKTTWVMLDAALDGKVRDALFQLDLLLAAGETPVGVLAQISYTLRQFAAATRLVRRARKAGRKLELRAALTQVGMNSFFLDKSQRQLDRLGLRRGSRLYHWLLEADLDLKGDSALPPRLILERLVVRLAAPQQEVANTG